MDEVLDEAKKVESFVKEIIDQLQNLKNEPRSRPSTRSGLTRRPNKDESLENIAVRLKRFKEMVDQVLEKISTHRFDDTEGNTGEVGKNTGSISEVDALLLKKENTTDENAARRVKRLAKIENSSIEDDATEDVEGLVETKNDTEKAAQNSTDPEENVEDGRNENVMVQQEPVIRYPCGVAHLGPNMIYTIQKAVSELGAAITNERGYLILKITDLSWKTGDITELLRNATVPMEQYATKGFEFKNKGHNYIQPSVDGNASVDLSEFEDLKCNLAKNPKQQFQNWVDHPPERVSYLICDPLKEHGINQLLQSGNKLRSRGLIHGVNTPYWYVSCDESTPATIHIEDGNTGSANLLVAGAEKHWMIIHRGSATKFEQCIRNEFQGSKDCSQFVRHHNLLLGPAWLEERNIAFEIVSQKPGEIMCTLPGRTYHAVRNDGRNFAVAINFEFEDAPDQPTDYNWCKKGKYSCGEHVLTLHDFLPKSAIRKRHHNTSSNISTVPSSYDSQSSVQRLSLPNAVPDQDADITALTQAILAQKVDLQWFDCQNCEQFNTKLGKFAPKMWLDDGLLRKLLQISSSAYHFVVAESIGLDVFAPTADMVREYAERDVKGIVFPFHVNMSNQSSPGERNHWVLGIFNYMAQELNTYGMEYRYCQSWASTIEGALKEFKGESYDVKAIQHEVCDTILWSNASNTVLAPFKPR